MTENEQGKDAPIAIVRGVGDVGSAIAWDLFHAGFIVISHENRQPRTIRRRMAFCDALWVGESELAGLEAHRIDRLEDVLSFAKMRKAIALYAGSFEGMLQSIKPDLIVDGRIQKFSEVEAIKGRAQFTIGIGPSFIAQKHVDVVVESCWGDDLGQVIEEGSAVKPAPVPPRLNGVGWERFVRADTPGRFETEKDIGDFVSKGEKIGHIEGGYVLAPISGYLRGLLYSGLSVLKEEKICEIDPRETEAHFVGLAERPQGISAGVLRAVEAVWTKK